MAKQTLVQAIHLSFSGKSQELARAVRYLDGCPVGGWGETVQAERRISEELPFRSDRKYTRDQFIESAYSIDSGDRYRTRDAGDAAEQARLITEQLEVAAVDVEPYTLVLVETDHYGWVVSTHRDIVLAQRAMSRQSRDLPEDAIVGCMYELVPGRLGKVGERVRYA